MNIFDYKCPSFFNVTIDSRSVVIHPISQLQLHKAKQAAKDWFVSHGCKVDSENSLYNIEVCMQILSEATDLPTHELRLLDLDSIDSLFNQWMDLQIKSLPDVDKFTKAVRRAIYFDSEAIVDGILAAQVETPSEFYDMPLARLTTGQVLYFIILRNAYLQKCDDKEQRPNKMVSKKALMQA